MATDLPSFISAEAAVKSKRPDYVSLFDPKADINDLKKCRADPAIMKEAVKKLKELGFYVTATGNCSVFFFGLRGLFERTFQVVLSAIESPSGAVFVRAQPVDAAGVPAPGALASALVTFVPAALADSLSAILISQPATPASGTRPASGSNPADIYLDELRTMLQLPPTPGSSLSATGKGVKVCVLDSGLRKDHLWFKGRNVKIVVPQSMDTIRAARRLLDDLESVKRTIIELKLMMWFYRDARAEEKGKMEGEVRGKLAKTPIQGLVDAHPWFQPLKKLEWKSLSASSNLSILGTPGSVLERCLTACEKDNSAIDQAQALIDVLKLIDHGTGVSAIVLAVAPEVELHSINRRQNGGALRNALKIRQPFVLNCSFGIDELPEAAPNATVAEKAAADAAIAAAQKSWKDVLDLVAAEGALCVISSGNVNDPVDPKNQRPQVEPSVHHLAAIVVGAGFYDPVISGPRVPKASSLSLAHPAGDHRQAMPQICALSAGQGPPGGYFPGQIYCPAGESGWELVDGTSYAAPQVSGACALIKEAWPGATPADVKALLLATSVPLKTGQAWNPVAKAPYPLWNENTGHKVGLLHIGRAVDLARFCALVTVAGGAFSGLGAVHIISRLKTLNGPSGGQYPLVLANGAQSVGWQDALGLFL